MLKWWSLGCGVEKSCSVRGRRNERRNKRFAPFASIQQYVYYSVFFLLEYKISCLPDIFFSHSILCYIWEQVATGCTTQPAMKKIIIVNAFACSRQVWNFFYYFYYYHYYYYFLQFPLHSCVWISFSQFSIFMYIMYIRLFWYAYVHYTFSLAYA